jgi:glucose/arabinose dehydrogenase
MLSRRARAITAAVLTLLPASAAAQLRAEPVASGFTQPVAFVQDPSDPTVQVVVQQDGRIRVLKDGLLQAADYLDLHAVVLNSGEQGLLGFAFAPNYASSGRVFVNFINLSGHTVVARFVRSAANPLRADPATRFDFLWPGGQRFIAQPFANHNGGNLAFGPDGFLYIGMGDGGAGDDPFHHAQNPQSLLGKMLRIDVSVPDADVEGYNVPATNPFAGAAGVLPEIWSFGLRNPWRWSFDNPARGGTGALVIGDVGQGAWEEVDYEPPGRGGRNYGWRNREGAHNHVTSLPAFFQPLTDPVHEYNHSQGSSITGGFVYRGSALGLSFRGRYFFADFVASRVWSIRLTVNASTGEATAGDLIEHTSELGTAARNVASFGEDTSGELYIVSYAGAVSRLASTVQLPSSGRRRPASSPVLGIAVPRGSGGSTQETSTPPVDAAPASIAQLRAQPVVSGLTQPVAFVQDPSDATVQMVVQQDGRIRVLKNGVMQTTDYLDLSSVVLNDGDRGLPGFAFAPDYATSGRVFVNFINLAGDTVIARFVRSASNPLRADAARRFDLMWPGGQRFIAQMFGGHNGGNIAFGSDGYLYIGMGDGGGAGDLSSRPQDPQSLMGKMIRIDVSVPDADVEGYNVPATNPFVGVPGVQAEIWSFGLRNPWRWSFDNPRRGGTGALVIADVGEGDWEEVDYEPAGRGGRNYGWPNREGAHSLVTSPPAFSQALTDPTYEYHHDQGQSITGGFVYRGTALGLSFRGRYFFADFQTGRVWSLQFTVNPSTGEAAAGDLIEHTSQLGAAAMDVASFGEDASGELYLVSYFAGAVYRIASTVPLPTDGRRRPASVPAIGSAIARNAGSAPASVSGAPATTSATVAAPAAFAELFLRHPAAAMALLEQLMDAVARGESVDDVWLALWITAARQAAGPPIVSRSRR